MEFKIKKPPYLLNFRKQISIYRSEKHPHAELKLQTMIFVEVIESLCGVEVLYPATFTDNGYSEFHAGRLITIDLKAKSRKLEVWGI